MAAGRSLTIEAHGVTLSLDFVDRGMMSELAAALPPGARAVGCAPGCTRLSVAPDGRVTPSQPASRADPGPQVTPLERLAAELRQHIALHSPDIFVHAGVVAVDGCALVLPGRSHTGKTSLVAALLHHGAEYLSDEYAVIDDKGLVQPFAKPLSIRRTDGGPERSVSATDLGARIGEGPHPAALVAVTRFRCDARWNPRPLCRADAVLALLEHTVAARLQPRRALHRLRLLTDRAFAVGGPRGEAEAVAADLISRIRRRGGGTTNLSSGQ